MPLNRYNRTPVLAYGAQYGTSYAIPIIRENVKNNNIRYSQIILKEKERLDIIAGQYYGNSLLWWILAAASNIGWGLQVPPGTIITIPNLDDVAQYIG